jgi:Flp pilus assembly protein TadD
VDAAPDDPDALAALAVHLADVTQSRATERAVELARRATQVGPRSSPAWSALSLALLRNGEAAGAADAARQAVTFTQGGHLREHLLLALAEHARGDAAEGRRWYDKARASAAHHPDPTTERLLAEAKKVFATK